MRLQSSRRRTNVRALIASIAASTVLSFLMLATTTASRAQSSLTVTISGSPTGLTVCANQAITLTASISSSDSGCQVANASYTWFVDGAYGSGSGNHITLMWTAPGQHTVGCQVQSPRSPSGMCGGASSVLVAVQNCGGGGCTFSSSASPNPACVGAGITFSAGYSGTGCPTIVDWYFDGASGTRYPGATVQHSFATSGTHTGTVTDSGGNTANVTVTVNPAGIQNLQASGAPSPACIGEAIQFNASASEGCGSGTITYTWAFDGSGSTTGASVSHAFTTSGQHTATVTASDGVNTSQQTSVTVQVNAPAFSNVSISPATVTVCPGVQQTYTASATDACARDGITYTWHFDDNTAGTGSQISHAFATPGPHTVTVTAADGAASGSAIASVTILTPSISVSLGPVTPGGATTCDDVHFSVSSSGTCLGNVGYTWHFDDGSADQTGPAATRKFTSTGNHVVTVTASDGTTNGSASVTVNIAPCSQAKVNTPGAGLPSDPWQPVSCPLDLQIDPQTGDARATVPDPVATRGYPLTVNIHFDSQPVELGRPMANATFTYDIHLATQTLFDTACNGSTHRMLVDGDATRYDFGPITGGLSPPPGFHALLTTAGSGWTLQNAGPPEALSSSGGFRYDFDSQGRLTRITDPANNAQVLAYGGPNGLLSNVTDLNTGRQAAFFYTGTTIAQVVENSTVATNLTYSGGFLTQVAVTNGMTAVESVQLTYNADATFHTLTKDNDPNSLVTFSYTPWPSRDCQHSVMLANATDATGRASAIDWSQPAVPGVAESVYRANAKGGLFRYDFSGSGDLVRIVTPTLTGASAPTTLSFGYDANHNCTSASDGTNTVTATWDTLGNVTSATLGGATWSATYAGSDLLTTNDPLNHTTSVTYGDNALPHVPTGFTDELGLTSWATHNPFGQTLTATDPQNHTSSVVYDESNGPNRGYPLYATDPNGDVVSFDSYDGLGDLTSLSTYPIHGNSAVRNTTAFFYDAVQRLTAIQNPDGTSSQAFYNGHNLSYTLDEKGTRYDFSYCAPCGILTSITGPLGWNLHWTYDADHDLTAFTDARGKVTSYSYGTAGDLNRITYPDGTHLDARYDQFGRMTQAINGRGVAVSLGYDGAGRITSVTAPSGYQSPGNSRTYSYYADGSLMGFTDEVGTTSFTYTPRGQVQTVTYDYRVSGLPAVQTLAYSYNPDGSRATLNWSVSPTIGIGTWTYGYDAGGRLTSLVNPYNQTTSWSWDGDGKITSQFNANGTSTVYSYNQQRSWPTQIQQNRGANPFATYALAYDNGANSVGLLTGVGEQDGSSVVYGYDSLYRLTSESRQGTNPATHSYGYDLAGNMTSFDGIADAFDDADKEVYFNSYDGDGNPFFVAGGVSQWDALGQLRDVRGTAYGQSFENVYGYDGLGRMVYSAGNASKGFCIYDGNLLLGTVFANTDGTWGTSAVYTWGAAGLVSQQSGSSSWYHFGPQGETRYLTDGTGTVAATYNYSAYGYPTASTGSVYNPFQYGGQFGYLTVANGYPSNTILLCGARWYDPSARRWLTRDPSGYDGGPNLYEYCLSDPVNVFDPSGLAPGQETGLQHLPEHPTGYASGAGTSLAKEIPFELAEKQAAKAGIGRATGALLADLLPGAGWAYDGYQILGFIEQLADSHYGGQVSEAMAHLNALTDAGEYTAEQSTFLANSLGDQCHTGSGSQEYKDKVAEAEKLYPKLRGKVHLHHIVPQYMGGANGGKVVALSAAYHQLITNAFRKEWGYGVQGGPAGTRRLWSIMQKVYRQYPIPR